jgi:8-amino-3,8-dideoxy-alpha-D-manno-octulosonate transaminase
VDDSFCLDPLDLERRITPRTRLIVAVHMAGNVCNMKTLLAVARRHGVPVLEDCAQANGGSFQGRKVGSFGRIGMFSLQWNKNATAGEGGLLVTQDGRLYDRLVAAHDLGIPWVGDAPTVKGPESTLWGAGRRMGELAGAVASVQLRKLPRIVRHLRGSHRRIQAALQDLPGVEFRRSNDPAGDTGAFLILLLPDADMARRAALRIRQAGFPHATRVSEYGMHIYSNVPQLVRQAPLSPAGNPWSLAENRASRTSYAQGTCPVSDALFARSILLPIPSRLDRSQERAGVAALRRALSESLPSA